MKGKKNKMNLQKIKLKLQIATKYLKLINSYLRDKGLKHDFEKYCEEKIGKEKIDNDKENLI